MIKWQIWTNHDETEAHLVSKEQANKFPKMYTYDTDHKKMRLGKEFKAKNYEEAKVMYNKFMKFE